MAAAGVGGFENARTNIHPFQNLREERRPSAALLAQVNTLNELVEDLQRSIGNLETQVDLGERRITELNDRASRAEAALDAANSTIAAQSRRIAELSTQAENARLVASGEAGVLFGLTIGCMAAVSPETFAAFAVVGAAGGIGGQQLYDYYTNTK